MILLLCYDICFVVLLTDEGWCICTTVLRIVFLSLGTG